MCEGEEEKEGPVCEEEKIIKVKRSEKFEAKRSERKRKKRSEIL